MYKYKKIYQWINILFWFFFGKQEKNVLIQTFFCAAGWENWAIWKMWNMLVITLIYTFHPIFYSETESRSRPPSGGHVEWQHELHGSHDGDDVITARAGRSPSPAPSPAHAGPAARIPAPCPPSPRPCTEQPSPPAEPRAPQLPPAPPSSSTRPPDLSTPIHALRCFAGTEMSWVWMSWESYLVGWSKVQATWVSGTCQLMNAQLKAKYNVMRLLRIQRT